MKTILILTIAFLSLNLNANAGNLSISSCMDKDETSAIFECLDQAAQQEEEKINRVYWDLQSLLKEKGKTELSDILKSAELAWIKLSNSQCKFNALSEDTVGEASGAAEMICNIQESIKRRYEIAGMLEAERSRDSN